MRLLLAFLIILMPGCATQQLMPYEQQVALKEKCEPVGGCVAVPILLWRQIEQMIATLRDEKI